MELKVNTKEFETLLGKAINVVPSSTINAIVENLKLTVKDRRLTLSATDTHLFYEASMDIDFDGELKIILPSKLLYDTIKTLSDTEIKMVIDDAARKIKFITNTGVYVFSLLNSDLFPTFPEVSYNLSYKIESSVLRSALEKNSATFSKEDTRLSMSGVLVDIQPSELRFVSTDGHKLVKFSLTGYKNEFTRKIIIPGKAISFLNKLLSSSKEAEIHFSDVYYLKLVTENDVVVARLIDEEYPNYEAVIPLENENILEFEKATLLKVLKRISLYANAHTKQIKLSIKKDIIDVSAENLENGGEASEKLLCEYSGQQMEISFKANFLIDLLELIKSDKGIFKLANPSRACIIEPLVQEKNENFMMLVMPMRVNS